MPLPAFRKTLLPTPALSEKEALARQALFLRSRAYHGDREKTLAEIFQEIDERDEEIAWHLLLQAEGDGRYIAKQGGLAHKPAPFLEWLKRYESFLDSRNEAWTPVMDALANTLYEGLEKRCQAWLSARNGQISKATESEALDLLSFRSAVIHQEVARAAPPSEALFHKLASTGVSLDQILGGQKMTPEVIRDVVRTIVSAPEWPPDQLKALFKPGGRASLAFSRKDAAQIEETLLEHTANAGLLDKEISKDLVKSCSVERGDWTERIRRSIWILVREGLYDEEDVALLLEKFGSRSPRQHSSIDSALLTFILAGDKVKDPDLVRQLVFSIGQERFVQAAKKAPEDALLIAMDTWSNDSDIIAACVGAPKAGSAVFGIAKTQHWISLKVREALAKRAEARAILEIRQALLQSSAEDVLAELLKDFRGEEIGTLLAALVAKNPVRTAEILAEHTTAGTPLPSQPIVDLLKWDGAGANEKAIAKHRANVYAAIAKSGQTLKSEAAGAPKKSTGRKR